MNVQVVDFKSDNAAEQFARSLRETGFGVITNHTISQELVDEVYEKWDRFFHSEERFDYLFDLNKECQDGYFPDGEIAKGEVVSDIKEFFHIYPNCKMPAYLEEATLRLREELFAMAKTMLSWLDSQLPAEISEQLDKKLFDMISDPRTLLRVIYYPAFDGTEEKGAIRAAAHGDINLITLIPAASAKGLQVQDTQGNWHEVPLDFGNIAINAGDMLDMLTKGYFKSTLHRVINPEASMKREARMSLPLFTHAQADVKLKPDFTVGDFLEERMIELGLRKRVTEKA